MAQKKKEEKDEVALTEWQKRNVEFLKRKKKEEEEKEKLQQKLQAEKRAQFQKHLNKGETEEKQIEEKAQSSSKKKKSSQKTKEKKRVKPKQKKSLTKKQKAWRKASPVVVLSLAVLLFSLFLISPYSKKKVIQVEGLTHALEEDVLTQSGIADSDYFFSLLFQPGPYEQAIEQGNMWVKKAAISYKFPNIFTIKLTEYNVVGYMQTDAGYQPILENGKHAAAVNSTELPDNYLIINLENEDDIQTLVKAFADMDKELISNIRSVDLASTAATADLLSLTMYDGNIVRVPLSEIKVKLPYYSKIKSTLSEPSIIDMEVGLYATTAALEETRDAENDEPASSDDDGANAEASEAENTEGQEEAAQEEGNESQEIPDQPDSEAETAQ
ncbi:cell division protein FtsQ/DivIB [Streptococcus sp. H49]|uniref:cell division protein FtsQ/DivIB n=1 Tax=Streptococcus huangxiaojuni TaxID=3237239 RepID=UPI0034A33736